MNFPLYRPPHPSLSRRRPFPFVTVTAASVSAVLGVGAVAEDLARTVDGLGPVTACALAIALVAALLVLAWCESGLLETGRRLRATRRHRRDTMVFESDLRAALEGERREIVHAARQAEGVIVGHGTVDSEIRVSGDPTRFVHERVPLVVRPPGVIRVLGPPGLSDAVLDALVVQLRTRHRTAGVLEIGERSLAGGRRITAQHRSGAVHWIFTTDSVPVQPSALLTEVWLGPDGTACVRTPSRTGNAWVPLEPCLVSVADSCVGSPVLTGGDKW
ncbi:hypothetical protein GCM10025867_32580 [Frondihabitans sucicola]|uniref:Type VII secretion protein EccE n=1 Tax=Frondihabitans sucicola TaxID=1268041 RepID=A0ABM8GRC5_9MICO|nr:hypothetical protein [Frondihabitans sucicola]BDZ51017.1 hypothetical protein GCM10025867_32580 [Frondihabitans sucicola]